MLFPGPRAAIQFSGLIFWYKLLSSSSDNDLAVQDAHKPICSPRTEIYKFKPIFQRREKTNLNLGLKYPLSHCSVSNLLWRAGVRTFWSFLLIVCGGGLGFLLFSGGGWSSFWVWKSSSPSWVSVFLFLSVNWSVQFRPAGFLRWHSNGCWVPNYILGAGHGGRWVAETEEEHWWLSGGRTVSLLRTRQAPQCSSYIFSINPAQNDLLLEEKRARLFY